MWPFNSKTKVKKGKTVRTIKIQATEGEHSHIIIESLLTGMRLNTSVPGTINAFITYESQVGETYKKYNGFSNFGCQQTRTVIDLRVAFICGEGISVSAKDDNTSEWIENFLLRNKLDGTSFINAVKGSEMAGQSLLVLKPAFWQDDELFIKVSRVPYRIGIPYKPVYSDPLLNDEVIAIMVKKDGIWIDTGYSNFIYVRTGGDDSNSEGPVTKANAIADTHRDAYT